MTNSDLQTPLVRSPNPASAKSMLHGTGNVELVDYFPIDIDCFEVGVFHVSTYCNEILDTDHLLRNTLGWLVDIVERRAAAAAVVT